MKLSVASRARSLDYLWAVISAILALANLCSELTATAMFYMAIQFSMAILFLTRRAPLVGPANRISCIVAVSSMLYVYLYQLDQVLPSGLGDSLLGVGAIFCLLAMLSLNNCFAVLPTYRGVRTGGLYRVVRHPIYASYIVMDVGIILICPSLWNAVLFAIAIGLFIWRIQCEESLLSQFASYRAYQATVPYRLIPLVF
jgi:protein-S-isoprenylcysteine O-methyltransferase Ste14